MLTPNRQLANKIEKIMLLSMWAHTLKKESELPGACASKKYIFAGLGKPTYPINAHTIASYLSYWRKLDEAATKWRAKPESILENSAIDYGDPRGDDAPRKLMAKMMSAWYDADIKSEHVLFTVGGIGALRVIFETLNAHYDETPGYRIITPFPHYSAYANNPLHCLHPIHVMQEPGYKLTARALETSIQEAYLLAESDHGWPKAVLFCNPSNPLGNIIDPIELHKIADVLRKYPELHIIFDEAYAEMSFVEVPSFLKIAPDLQQRVIIMRSATKALSAAGERMAVLLVFEPILMNEMLHKNISYFIHAPRSAQIAYAETMANFDAIERHNLSVFYKKKVDYVIQRLQKMGAAMPDPLYQVEATFYALGDFHDLLGLELPPEAERALQKTGKVTSGEDLAYYLLFEEAIMLAPMSYFGLSKDCGYLRITCSGNEQELLELMDRLEHSLWMARSRKSAILKDNILQKMPELLCMDAHMHEIVMQKMASLTDQEQSCLNLRQSNQILEKLLVTVVSFLGVMD